MMETNQIIDLGSEKKFPKKVFIEISPETS